MSRPQARQAGMLFILITVFLDVLTLGLTIPVAPALVKHFTGNEAQAATWIGLMAAGFAVMQFIAAPILGSLSDQFGRRRVILISVAGVAVDQLFMAFAPNIGWLLVGRLLAGVTAASITAANAYIADISGPENRARNFGMIGAAFGVGFVAGPAMGGLLGEIDLRLPFMVAAGLAALNFLYGMFVLPESLAPANRRPFSWRRANPVGSLRALGRHPMVLGLATARTCSLVAMGILHTVWVIYTTRRFGWSELENGLSLAAVGLAAIVVQGVLIGRVVKRLGEIRTIMLGLTMEATAYIGYGLAPTPTIFYCCIMIHALGGLTSPAIQSVVARKVNANEQGATQGAFASLQSMTFIIAPLLGSQLFAAFTASGAVVEVPGMPFFVGACMSVMAAAIVIRTVRRDAKQDQGTA